MKALEILMEFEGCNTDGTGFTYVRDGKFITHKWPKAISSLLKRGKPLLNHMPYDGWTIAHLRAASHGANTNENTHPFEIGKDWAICHNGIWSDYAPAKLALSSYVKFKGETDSEVAAHLINNLGPEKFTKEIDGGGVFMGLKLDGSLWVMKTSGDLVLNKLKNDAYLISSELDTDLYPNQTDTNEGWFHFDKDGKLVEHKQVEPWYSRFGKGVISHHIFDHAPGWDEHPHRSAIVNTGRGVSAISHSDYDWSD
jgi:predicted glutamine amidotransferase